MSKEKDEVEYNQQQISLLRKLINDTLVDDSKSVIKVESANSSVYEAAAHFEHLPLNYPILKHLITLGYYRPSKIQATSLPFMLGDPPANLVAQSQSGTGKTVAFVLCVLQRLQLDNRWPQCLCLVPTCELAVQICDVFRKLGSYAKSLSIALATRSPDATIPSPNREITDHVIVGTPGTVLYWLIHLKCFYPQKLNIFILDEADVMLNLESMGEQSLRLIRALRDDCQRLLFSATYNSTVKTLFHVAAKDPVTITVENEELVLDNIEQFYIQCKTDDEKLDAICNFYKTLVMGQCVIFCETRGTARWVAARMRERGHRVAVLSGEMGMEQRAETIKRFRIRQIDIEAYIHRIGRCGRFGRRGLAFTFVMDLDELGDIQIIGNYLSKPLKKLNPFNLKSLSDLESRDFSQFMFSNLTFCTFQNFPSATFDPENMIDKITDSLEPLKAEQVPGHRPVVRGTNACSRFAERLVKAKSKLGLDHFATKSRRPNYSNLLFMQNQKIFRSQSLNLLIFCVVIRKEAVYVISTSKMRQSPPPSTSRCEFFTTTQNRDNLKRMVVKELVETEEKYVTALEHVMDNYFCEMQRCDLPSALLGQRFTIFANFEQIYEFHKNNFFPDLQEAWLKCSSANSTMSITLSIIAKCFSKHQSKFCLYSVYYTNKPKSEALMKDYGNAFFQAKQSTLSDSLNLSAYLLKPVQRMSEYVLLLDRMLDLCVSTRGSGEFNLLKKAKEILTDQLRSADDMLAVKSIRGCDVSLTEQGSLLRRDQFLVSKNGQKHKKTIRQIFLFEKLILFAKSSWSDLYEYKCSIPMTEVGLTVAVTNCPLAFEIWFRRRTLKQIFLIHASELGQKQAWIADISNLLWHQAIHNRDNRVEHRIVQSRPGNNDNNSTQLNSSNSDRMSSSHQQLLNKNPPRPVSSPATTGIEEFDNTAT
ncbi:DEAD/DEAH box helicase [Trichinella nativa]|uniref:RNA helicase n=1 Tax=Trichinella nativa TaxID=6335 RepID=A0A1Y3E5P6_9BILA|nr:DEAD/DEAH box helicase [Trichinella nativa]